MGCLGGRPRFFFLRGMAASPSRSDLGSVFPLLAQVLPYDVRRFSHADALVAVHAVLAALQGLPLFKGGHRPSPPRPADDVPQVGLQLSHEKLGRGTQPAWNQKYPSVLYSAMVVTR